LNSTFSRLKNFTDNIGPVYGTEDWCLWLYALVKMQRPNNVLELGTGLGACALWIALGLKENGVGKVFTVDDGRDWPTVVQNTPELFTPAQRAMDFSAYLASLQTEFGLEDWLQPVHGSMPPLPAFDQPIDLLFSDFSHGPNELLQILGQYLPGMSASSSVFLDSASTSFASYAMLELLVQQLNAGKIPRMLLTQVGAQRQGALWEQVRTSRYDLIHMVERKARAQNSTAWLKIQPVDLRPYPAAPFH
jgi:predicted O-methyltransferase YrrM